MKTKEIIDALICCTTEQCNNSCPRYSHKGSGCVKELVKIASDRLLDLDSQVKSCNKAIAGLKSRVDDKQERIYKLKNKIRELKKELAEREAEPCWISVEERMPEDGKMCFVSCKGSSFPSRYKKGEFGVSDVTYWMPIPDPPKKVKTYADVYRERIKEAFPDLEIDSMKPDYCRAAVFAEEIDCEDICGGCEECWNQPYEKEDDK